MKKTEWQSWGLIALLIAFILWLFRGLPVVVFCIVGGIAVCILAYLLLKDRVFRLRARTGRLSRTGKKILAVMEDPELSALEKADDIVHLKICILGKMLLIGLPFLILAVLSMLIIDKECLFSEITVYIGFGCELLSILHFIFIGPRLSRLRDGDLLTESAGEKEPSGADDE